MNRIAIIVFLVLVSIGSSFGQVTDIIQKDTTVPDTSIFPIIDADFLFGYYEQDGVHSPVTGGKGTELLWDYVQKTSINVQLDSFRIVALGFGIDQYTSASTDNIDLNVSSASRQDTRVNVNGSFSYKTRKQATYTVGGGFSTEFDVLSWNALANFNKLSASENTGFGFGFQFYHDLWSLIYPIELRTYQYDPNHTLLTQNVRTLLLCNFNFFHILNKRTQLGLYADFIYQQGLLSTPFHRVFFSNGVTDIERLPNTKWKLPVSARLSYFVNDNLVIKWFNRLYVDAFDLKAYTSTMDLIFKMSKNYTFGPFYRYHIQSSSKYFKPYLETDPNSVFHSSDYDLSALNSHRMGMAIKYAPLYGVLRFQNRFMSRKSYLKSLSLRAGYYIRNDGLRASFGSLGMSWVY